MTTGGHAWQLGNSGVPLRPVPSMIVTGDRRYRDIESPERYLRFDVPLAQGLESAFQQISEHEVTR